MPERDAKWDTGTYQRHRAQDAEENTRSSSPDPLNLNPDIDDLESTIRIDGIQINMFDENQPQSYKEAMSSEHSDKWQVAIKEEYDGLIEMGTWKLVDLPKGRKPVKCRWTFVVKLDGRYKARLVAKGFTQVQGIDYEETFSPVARFESVRFLLSIAALNDWEIEAMDVKLAFLHGYLEEEIYMEQPEGFIKKGKEKKVCKLI